MRIGPSLILASRQTLAMTPQLQQAIKLLQFSHLELAAFIQHLLVTGRLMGLAAIALINGGGGAPTKAARTAVGLAIVAGIGFGLFFVLNHAGSSGGVTTFVSGRFASALASFCFALFSRVSPLPRRSVLPIIAIGGSFDGIGVVLYLFATFHGLLSLSAVLTSFYPAFTVLCARLFIGEKLAAVQLLGAVLAIAAPSHAPPPRQPLGWRACGAVFIVGRQVTRRQQPIGVVRIGMDQVRPFGGGGPCRRHLWQGHDPCQRGGHHYTRRHGRDAGSRSLEQGLERECHRGLPDVQVCHS